MLSIERTLRKLINSAERSLAALAERDSLNALKEQRTQDQSPSRDGSQTAIDPDREQAA